MERASSLVRMSPPSQKKCYVPDCEYLTTLGIPNYDLVMKDLDMHIRCVHAISSARPQEAHGAAKPDKLPRPLIGEGITESDWAHFEDKWGRYKRSTLQGVSSQHLVDQLWACCEQSLETAVYNSGVNSNSDEETLMKTLLIAR